MLGSEIIRVNASGALWALSNSKVWNRLSLDQIGVLARRAGQEAEKIEWPDNSFEPAPLHGAVQFRHWPVEIA